MSTHICEIDCKPVEIHNDRAEVIGHGHQIYASLPTSAAGRYQWEENQRIFRQGAGARAAWRRTGQGQTRECRVWDLKRKTWRSGDLKWPMHSIRAMYRVWLPTD